MQQSSVEEWIYFWVKPDCADFYILCLTALLSGPKWFGKRETPRYEGQKEDEKEKVYDPNYALSF